MEKEKDECSHHVSIEKSLQAYIETMLPQIRPTPTSHSIAKNNVIRAYLSMLPNSFLVDECNNVVSDVGHFFRNSLIQQKFMLLCKWDACTQCFVMKSQLPSWATITVINHMNSFFCVGIVTISKCSK